jgi:hypothetical protein
MRDIACKSVAGFQSESYRIKREAPVKLSPTPPALALSRNTTAEKIRKISYYQIILIPVQFPYKQINKLIYCNIKYSFTNTKKINMSQLYPVHMFQFKSYFCIIHFNINLSPSSFPRSCILRGIPTKILHMLLVIEHCGVVANTLSTHFEGPEFESLSRDWISGWKCESITTEKADEILSNME